ncbi:MULTISPECIES: aldo/keto reductase [unclassified Enterococcus]|uniref:aldo/keto reductase n=1 Tax=unclassified Enterococcus TaxID=2608891 RepID=UPI001A91BEA7|nr:MULTISPECIES: aldo/keto reductase [unclassified Enterococcus]MBO0461104.1 aldo/keto reductase [Enterococcus sp. DIV1298c]MBO1300107.1 aldo/keto reductase [Enterococcus sp. DIV1271a]
MLQEYYTLFNGNKIPKLGLGTWFIEDQEADKAVKDAMKVGYRLIDTAQAYGNEVGVGKGIRESNIAREEIFVTSKIAAEEKSYDSAAKSIDETLEKMGLDYLDLMIIHSPQPWKEFRGANRYFKENIEVWRALEDAYDEGKVRAIGVSNFLEDDLQNILDNSRIKPMVNQILVHISNTPSSLIEFCQHNDILVEAYSPIAHGEALKNPAIQKIAEKYHVSVPQLCIRYDLQLGTVVLPKTANLAHMKMNAEIDFVISEEDMEKLKHIEQIQDYGDSSFFPVFGGEI